MLLDTADKGREKAIESYYSIKKRLRGKDDDKSEMLLTTYVKNNKFYTADLTKAGFIFCT